MLRLFMQNLKDEIELVPKGNRDGKLTKFFTLGLEICSTWKCPTIEIVKNLDDILSEDHRLSSEVLEISPFMKPYYKDKGYWGLHAVKYPYFPPRDMKPLIFKYHFIYPGYAHGPEIGNTIVRENSERHPRFPGIEVCLAQYICSANITLISLFQYQKE